MVWCNQRKWVVVMLDEEIEVDEVAIANYEFYSSTLKDFVVLGR